MEVYENQHAPLSSLKSNTEYCVQVSVFGKDFDNSSNYTTPQCVYTTGKKKRNIYSWTWWRHVLYPLYLMFLFVVAVVAWRLDISFLSLLGRPLVWLKVVLPVLCGSLLIIILTFLYKFHKFRRKPSEYMTPESLLVRISSSPPFSLH